MRRRAFIALLGGAVVWPFATIAQHTSKWYRVSYIALLPGEDSGLIEPLLQRLRELGYSEGKNLAFEYRSAEGRPERLEQLAAELVRAEPDVLVAGWGTLTAQVAKAATTTVPVVFTSAGDPIGAGVIASLNQPGGNVTGLTSQASDILGKRLQILAQLIPADHAVAVVLNPDTPFSALAVHELRTAARGRRFDIFEARTAEQVSAGIEAAAQSGAGGLLTLEDFLILSVGRQIVDLAAKVRLPTVFGSRDLAEAGGLISYGTDRRQLHRRAADYVDRILKGAKPADLPVEQPSKFEFVINLKTARSLGLEVPPSLLALADEVIE
jgi:putative ABC transport system substrate-binding protein